MFLKRIKAKEGKTQTDESQRTLLGRLGLKIPTRLGEPQWSPDTQM